MRIFDAQVQNGRLLLNASVDIMDEAVIYLVSVDDVVDEILALDESADRIALHLELLASDHDVKAGRLLDFHEVLATLRAKHSGGDRGGGPAGRRP